MARRKVAVLAAAAGIGIALGISAAGVAAEDAQLPAAQSQPVERPSAQGMGGTSGTAPTGTVAENRMERSAQDSGGPFEDTYLTPYEIRTPGARDNIDD